MVYRKRSNGGSSADGPEKKTYRSASLIDDVTQNVIVVCAARTMHQLEALREMSDDRRAEVAALLREYASDEMRQISIACIEQDSDVEEKISSAIDELRLQYMELRFADELRLCSQSIVACTKDEGAATLADRTWNVDDAMFEELAKKLQAYSGELEKVMQSGGISGVPSAVLERNAQRVQDTVAQLAEVRATAARAKELAGDAVAGEDGRLPYKVWRPLNECRVSMDKVRKEFENMAARGNGTGVAFVQPWEHPVMPFNPSTDKVYCGRWNLPMLMNEMSRRALQDPRFLGKTQAEDMGAHLKEGAIGVPIFRLMTKKQEVEPEEESPEPAEKTRTINSRFFAVNYIFHASDFEGLPAYESPHGTPSALAKKWGAVVNEAVQACADALGMRVERAYCDEAYYAPGSDTIRLPTDEQFTGSEDLGLVQRLAETSFHELGHATSKALERKVAFLHEDRALYAEEELCAQLCSLRMATQLGLPYSMDSHEGYLSSWMKSLQKDPDALTRAMEASEKAANLLMESIPLELVQELQAFQYMSAEEAEELLNEADAEESAVCALC